ALFLGAAGYVGRGLIEQSRQRKARAAAEDEASRILARAQEEADNLRTSKVLEGKEEAFRLREAWEKEEQRHREDDERAEQRLAERADALDRRFNTLNEKESAQEQRSRELDQQERELTEQAQEVDRTWAEVRKKLEALAGTSAAEAKQELIEDLKDEARADAANDLREIKEEAQRNADRESKQILGLAIQRMAADQTAEMTVSVVQLPSDEMKGRIIGREGRNIRSFEQATGIDVIIDDTPEAVVLSGFDPVRREVARISLQRLIEDGRIHPGRIEEMVEKSRKEVEQSMVEAAEEVLYELGIHNVHSEIVKVLGRLKFRTSYGQNQLQHAKEVALLAGNMAAEMGLDVPATKRAGVLHDVGKGLTHEQEGTHVELGYRLCKKHNESEIVLNAIRAHHDEEPHFFAETFLVTAGDAISGSRPGARREMFEGYVKRLEKLEELAMEHPGVERCFAIQAGREIRVMVEPEKVSDNDMAQISEAVARRIEGELQYPGQIKVVVIRETRAIDFAR
ncbi:MAG: ribonuclease Y, partial [Longimicrobiales bacterium]